MIIDHRLLIITIHISVVLGFRKSRYELFISDTQLGQISVSLSKEYLLNSIRYLYLWHTVSAQDIK